MVSDTIQSIKDFTVNKSTELQFQLDQSVISSFATIIEKDVDGNKYKYIRRFEFLDIDNPEDDMSNEGEMTSIFEKLFGIISAADKIRNEKNSIKDDDSNHTDSDDDDGGVCEPGDNCCDNSPSPVNNNLDLNNDDSEEYNDGFPNKRQKFLDDKSSQIINVKYEKNISTIQPAHRFY